MRRVSAHLQALPGQPLALRPPKRYSSIRTVPLPDTVADAISEHLRRWPPLSGGEDQDELLVRTVTAGRCGRGPSTAGSGAPP